MGMEDRIDIEDLLREVRELPDFSRRKVQKIVTDYKKEKDEAEIVSFDVCPKCGKEHPHLTMGGKTKAGKQMLRCQDCGHRFVIDHNEITFYSRLSKEQWNEGIKSIISGDIIDTTAEKCDVTHRTAFKMRHKVMSFMEKDEDSIQVAEEVELDETHLPESRKGKEFKEQDDRKPRKRGEKATKRGISDEKVCLLTATQRKGGSFLRSYNMGRPSSEEVMNLVSHIKEESYLWTDNHSSYNKLTETLGSKRVIVSSHEEYDQVNHLNTVNSFHSSIKKWNAKMRGVATKYINRYAALFNVRWLCRGLDESESLLKARKRIKSLGRFISLNWDEVDNHNHF